LDLLFLPDLKKKVAAPQYIADGLAWLSDQMARKNCETMNPINGDAP
jgi:hypothetical protein